MVKAKKYVVIKPPLRIAETLCIILKNMNAYQKLFDFLDERKILISDIENYKFDFQKYPIPDSAGKFVVGPRFPKTGKEILVIIKSIVYYTNHLQDYVNKLAIESGRSEKFKTDIIKENEELQILSYLSNEHKHAGIDRQNWGDNIKPKYGNPFIQYQNLDKGKMIPGFSTRPLYPTVQLEGQGLLDMKFDIGNVTDVLITVIIHDRNDNKIGDAWSYCIKAASIWTNIIEELGYEI